MLAIEVELLTGRYTATRFNDRNRPEWPPHPARLFSALVARWADHEPPDDAERAALEWLERLGAPEISCSEARDRRVVTHYVPGNDVSVVRSLDLLYEKLGQAETALREAQAAAGGVDARALGRLSRRVTKLRDQALTDSAKAGGATTDSAAARAAARALLPDGRGKQGRSYPTVIPEADRFWFRWPDAHADAPEIPHLDGLLRRVTRLGHSSSAVACRIVTEAGPAAWIPDVNGSESLRVPQRGQLEALISEFARHQGSEPRTLATGEARYRQVGTPVARPAEPPLLGGEWFVLARRSGSLAPVGAALRVAETVRASLLSAAGDSSPELLSGHVPGEPGQRTSPTVRPHLAIVPLPFVGDRHADGAVLGVALVLPRDASPDERELLLRTLGAWRSADHEFEVRLGRHGLLRLELCPDDEPRRTLQRLTWCRPARRWVSATPVALDRFPGDLRDSDPARRVRAEDDAVRSVVRACAYAGLPEPLSVELDLGSPMRGVPPLKQFPPYRRAGGLTRATVHVRLQFASAVLGPVLIGAGRYLGYGLCRPVREEAGHDR